MFYYNAISNLISRSVSTEIEYLRTATLGCLMFTDVNYQGVIYQSLCSKLNGDNFALKVNAVKDNLIFISARQLKVIDKKSANEMFVQCCYKSDRLNVEGDFIWEPVLNCETHLIRFEDSISFE